MKCKCGKEIIVEHRDICLDCYFKKRLKEMEKEPKEDEVGK